MGFLDNSGDIILDAVLTDEGRMRLARGDGSFKIVKYALGDDEINYKLYDKNNASGSAYYDLQILQTPVLEAFTNNVSSMKSKLMSMTKNNLLYLPVIKLNRLNDSSQMFDANTFLILVDSTTEDKFKSTNGDSFPKGILFGQTLDSDSHILLEQGLDTIEIPQSVALDSDLVETQYILEMDNRFGKPAKAGTANIQIAQQSFVDDDQIASYYFSLANNTDYVSDSWTGKADPPPGGVPANTNSIRGPQGTQFKFEIASSLDLATSTYLFDQLGTSTTINVNSTDISCLVLDSTIRVMGATTGYTVDIPVRYVKYTAS